MFEKPIESKTKRLEETKEAEAKTSVKDIAKEMLKRFYARIRKKPVIEKSEMLLEPIAESLEIEEKKEEEKESEREIIFPDREKQKREKEEKIDKEIYESIVTNNYFEGWDELELEGNPEIKDKIQENIINAEKKYQWVYEQLATGLKISVEEFKKRLQAKIENIVGQSEFFRATRVDVLDKIMNLDGRWKSQFETDTSQGALNPSYRAQQENNMFDFAIDSEKDKEKRPIYGYFSDEERGAINYVGKIPPANHVNGYGTINVKIKKERALKKATLTFHDSLSLGNIWPPTPAAKPHFTSLQFCSADTDRYNNLKQSSITSWGDYYTEVQYHNQLTMADVESIYISLNNGLYPEEIEEIRKIFNKYKAQHPESTIELIEF